jgi:hypothetical protein
LNEDRADPADEVAVCSHRMQQNSVVKIEFRSSRVKKPGSDQIADEDRMSDRRDSIRERCIPDVYIFDAMALRNARWPFSDTQLS